MRIKVTETPVYTWEELSDAAKDKARENWSRFLWADGSAAESMTMIFDDTMLAEGWENYGDLTFSLYMQGGQPMWTGDKPKYEHDGRIYSVQVRKRVLGGSSYGWDFTIDEEDADEPEYDTPEWHAYVERLSAVELAARDYCDGLASRLYQKFVEEDEYMVNDRQMAETSEANGYEYTEDGELA